MLFSEANRRRAHKPEGSFQPNLLRPADKWCGRLSSSLIYILGIGSFKSWHNTLPLITLIDIGRPSRAFPVTPPGIRVTYHGGSIGLCIGRRSESRKADRVEIAIAQGLLDGRVAGTSARTRSVTLRRQLRGTGETPRRLSSWEAVPPRLPLPPEVHPESPANPRVQVGEHSGSVTEAEVAAPPDEVWRQLFDELRQAHAELPASQFPDAHLEPGERLRRNLPLASVVRD